MNRKAMIENCVQYALTTELRQYMIDSMVDDIRVMRKESRTKAEVKKYLYDIRVNFIRYQATCLQHGKHYANNAFRSCIAEAMERAWA
jgi:hypothetical protein